MYKYNSKIKRRYSLKSFLPNVKQCLSFFIAFLIIQTILWTLLITTETNNKTSDSVLRKEYTYHFTVNGLSEHAYSNLQNVEDIIKSDRRLVWPEIEYLGFTSDGFGTRSYKIGIILDDSDPARSLEDFWETVQEHGLNISQSNAEYTPFYTKNPATRTQNKDMYTNLSVVFLALAVIFFIAVNKIKGPRSENEKGDRIYISTSQRNMYIILKRLLFTLMVLSVALSFIFFILLISLGNGISYFFLYIALLIVCALFLSELFTISINHYKFRYGIYMTFGAGFKKLYLTAVKEMGAISILTLLPSLAVSFSLCLLLYIPLGISLFVPFNIIFYVIIITLLIVLCSTYFPLKIMSLKLPSELLSAEDNSNLASSPRRSVDLSRKRFPIDYEFYSVLRFRKYFIRLTAIAVSFSTVFLCGLYISHTNKQNSEKDIHEFEISTDQYFTMSNEAFENMAYNLSDNETIKYFFWKDHTYATSLRLHALIKSENAARSKYAYTIQSDSHERNKLDEMGFSKTTDSFELVAYNQTLLDTIIDNGIYKVEGDIYSILNSDNTVIISEYISNILHFDFEVGDSIMIAVPGEKSADYNEHLIKTGKNKQALKEMIPKSDFTYKEYKIGAIIDYGGGDNHFIIGMNQNSYMSICTEAMPDKTPAFLKNIMVYVNDNATEEELDKLQLQLENEFLDLGYTVKQTYNINSHNLSKLQAKHGIILTVSFLIMFLSPVIWFCSQLKFSARRSKEIFILKALGATDKYILKLYAISGLLLAVLSAVMTLSMGYIADYIIYIVCTRLIPSMSSVSGVTVSFYMPPSALVICIVTSVICGFLSSILPFALKRFIPSKSDKYTVDGQ